jgi:hypothetical protein
MLRLMQATGINRLDAADIIRHQLHHQGVPVDRVIFRPHTPVRCLAMTAQGQRERSAVNRSLRIHWFLADEVLVLMQDHAVLKAQTPAPPISTSRILATHPLFSVCS